MSLDPSSQKLRQKIPDQLLHKLLTSHETLLKSSCDRLGFHIEELQPKPAASTNEKSLESPNQYEQRRLAKLKKLAVDLSSQPNSNLHTANSISDLLKALNLSPPKPSLSTTQEPSSIFHKPSDVIQYNIDKTQQKFNKSLQVIKRIETLKVEEQNRAEEKIKRSGERQKKLIEDQNKKDEDHEKQTMTMIEQRTKILQKKKEIVGEMERQFLEYGEKLEERMEKLSEINKKKLKEMVERQHEKVRNRINEDYSRILNDEMQVRIQDKEIRVCVQELEQRIEKRLNSYDDAVKRRVDNARQNNMKVGQVFSQSIDDYKKRTEQRLKKIIEKSIMVEERKVKKNQNYKKYSDDVRQSVASSFMRNSKGIDSLNEVESRRIQQIERRENEKTKIYKNLKNRFEVEHKEKRQKNSSRFEDHSFNYSKVLENQARLRSRIIDKHQRINSVAEELKVQKFLISNKKRTDNFEIQKIRSSATTSVRQKWVKRGHFQSTI